MRMNKWVLAAGCGMALLVGSVQADIHLSTSAKTNDQCDQLAGLWYGDAYISADLPIWEGGDLHCHYNQGSSGGITVTGGGSGSSYHVHVDVSKLSSDSDYRCPGSVTTDLPATCSNGAITIQSSNANLNGDINPDGKSADLSGTLTFSVPIVGDITTKVDSLHLIKK